jgi:hypothetical protein
MSLLQQYNLTWMCTRIESSKTYFICLCRAWTAASWVSGKLGRAYLLVVGPESPRRGRKRTHRQNQQRMRPLRPADGHRATPWTARAAARRIMRERSGLSRGMTGATVHSAASRVFIG